MNRDYIDWLETMPCSPGHNVADGVPLQDPSSSLTDADLVFRLGGHGYLWVATAGRR